MLRDTPCKTPSQKLRVAGTLVEFSHAQESIQVSTHVFMQCLGLTGLTGTAG